MPYLRSQANLALCKTLIGRLAVYKGVSRGLKSEWRQRTFATTPKGEKSSRELAKEIAAAKKMSREAAEKAAKSDSASADTGSVTSSFLVKSGLALFFTGGVLWMSFTESGNKFAKEHVFSKDSQVGFILDNASQLIMSPFQEQFQPSREKLLPDLPPIPAGHVAHRTLILDLEGTLCHSEWDRRNGWRAAKRPGLDEFLAKMCQMYEIVIFSSGTFMTDQPLTAQLDKYHAVQHFLYRDATLFKDGKYIKDLSKINRDLSRVIAVDDTPEELAYHQENVLKISTYDSRNLDDCELSKLGNFLEDIYHRDVKDIRKELASYDNKEDILDRFTLRKMERDKKEQEQRSKGLGGLIRRRDRKSVV